jgi:hypothetical protein
MVRSRQSRWIHSQVSTKSAKARVDGSQHRFKVPSLEIGNEEVPEGLEGGILPRLVHRLELDR